MALLSAISVHCYFTPTCVPLKHVRSRWGWFYGSSASKWRANLAQGVRIKTVEIHCSSSANECNAVFCRSSNYSNGTDGVILCESTWCYNRLVSHRSVSGAAWCHSMRLYRDPYDNHTDKSPLNNSLPAAYTCAFNNRLYLRFSFSSTLLLFISRTRLSSVYPAFLVVAARVWNTLSDLVTRTFGSCLPVPSENSSVWHFILYFLSLYNAYRVTLFEHYTIVVFVYHTYVLKLGSCRSVWNTGWRFVSSWHDRWQQSSCRSSLCPLTPNFLSACRVMFSLHVFLTLP